MPTLGGTTPDVISAPWTRWITWLQYWTSRIVHKFYMHGNMKRNEFNGIPLRSMKHHEVVFCSVHFCDMETKNNHPAKTSPKQTKKKRQKQRTKFFFVILYTQNWNPAWSFFKVIHETSVLNRGRCGLTPAGGSVMWLQSDCTAVGASHGEAWSTASVVTSDFSERSPSLHLRVQAGWIKTLKEKLTRQYKNTVYCWHEMLVN